MKMVRKLSIVSTAIVLGLGGLLVAAPANAAWPSCHVNYLCLYDAYGNNVFMRNGTYMYENGGYQLVGSVSTSFSIRSSVNATMGNFCTYDSRHRLTNILTKQTQGVLAVSNVRYVKIC